MRSHNDTDSSEGCYSVASVDVTTYDNPDLVVVDLEGCEDGITGGQDFDLDRKGSVEGSSVDHCASGIDANEAIN